MTNDMNKPQDSLHNQKKGYQPPNLIVYGDIREITKAVGQNQNSDGGKVKGQKNSKP